MPTPPTPSESYKHHIDLAQARLVAEAYLDARDASGHPLVRAAYADLGAQAEAWFDRLSSHRNPHGVRVVHTQQPQPYSSGEELSERVRSAQLLEMHPARADRGHPLLDTSVLSTYDRFRAVHDLVSHAHLGLGFDRHGEFSAWLVEDRMYRGLARWALATELHAEHSVLWTTGSFAERKATLLPRGLLRSSRACALAHRRGLRGSVDGVDASASPGHASVVTDDGAALSRSHPTRPPGGTS